MAKQIFLGVRLHLRVCWPSVIITFEVSPADVHELRAAEDLLEGVTRDALEDRNYSSPALSEPFRGAVLRRLAPLRKASRAQAVAAVARQRASLHRDGERSSGRALSTPDTYGHTTRGTSSRGCCVKCSGIRCSVGCANGMRYGHCAWLNS
jgi:hypothetical protein